MNVCAIMATCGRHKLAERSLRFFLDQNYEDKHTLLIYNNSPMALDLEHNQDVYSHKQVHLVNQHICSQTGKPYTNLGEIYNDALTYVGDGAEVVIHWDDDDIFLPNHITEGVKGLERGKFGKLVAGACEAYKPAKSYYRHPKGIELMSNTLEPSIFTAAYHIMEHGYSNTTTDQHLQWVNPLVYENKIFVDDNGPATLIYNWGDTDIPTFKTSGNAGHPNNFNNYRNFSQDHGDQVLTPWTKEEVQKYYDLVYAK
jgi:hypothetical protein